MWRNRPPFPPFRQCFLWPAVHRRVSGEMSEYGQVVITGALIFPLQVLRCSENNLHSPPVKVLWLHCRSVLMLSGNQIKTHKRETRPYCKLHELNHIQVRRTIAVIFYNQTSDMTEKSISITFIVLRNYLKFLSTNDGPKSTS